MMGNLYQDKYRIDSARLTEYDYGSNGMYFVTICARNKYLYFGEIEPDPAILCPSAIGRIAIDCWLSIPNYFPFIELDTFQVMPNHLHGILAICKPETEQIYGQPNQFGPQQENLAAVIRGFKAGVTKQTKLNQIEFGWQPRYYDRVVRNQNELDRIRTYIENNPTKWADDHSNLEGLYM
ncbi:transposase [Spirosoma humi]